MPDEYEIEGTDTATETATFSLAKMGMLNTAVGLDVLAEGLRGERIIFTKLAIGDGELNVTNEGEYRDAILNMTSMVNWRMDLPLVEIKNQGNGSVKIHAIKPNAEVAESFFAKEQAVFCLNPRTGKEILYAYRNSGVSSDFIPANTGPVTKMIDLTITTIIQNAQHVEAILDASFAYVALSEYKAHVDSEHPHPNTPNHYLNVTDADKFWVTNNDNHLHQMSVGNVKAMLLGDLTEKISDNESKLKELEIFTLAKNELGLDANLMIVEDFAPATEIDNFSVKVVSCARGGRLIGVESASDIVKGAYYWITDGVNQEMVQIKGVAYSTDYYHVTLEQALTYDYNVSTAKLYRTTYTGRLAEKKALSWSGQTFKGIEANIERQLLLDTVNSNKGAFRISCDGYLTTDGYYTLTQDKGRMTTGGTEVEETPSTDTATVPSGDCDHNCSCCAMSDTCTMSGA